LQRQPARLAKQHSDGTLSAYANARDRHERNRQEARTARLSRTQAEGITEALKELDVSSLVTKAVLELALATQTTTIITWMFGALLAQGALVVALIQYLK
jgi:hypothetical protein